MQPKGYMGNIFKHGICRFSSFISFDQKNSLFSRSHAQDVTTDPSPTPTDYTVQQQPPKGNYECLCITSKGQEKVPTTNPVVAQKDAQKKPGRKNHL